MLAVILGASHFPKAPRLASGRPFYNSAADLRDYFKSGLGIPEQNVNWLFDDSHSPTDQLEDIAAFITKRTQELKNEHRPAQDLLVYYVGHGLFERSGQAYCLAVRSTNENSEGASSIRAGDLATVIKENAAFLRRFLIFDCCFSATLYKEFQSGPLQVAGAKLREELPVRGTALLCSSNARDASLVPEELDRTMFSDALIRVLHQGHPNFGPTLSMSELGSLVKECLRSTYSDSWVRPEVLSPDQREGDVANISIFPNTAYENRLGEKTAAGRSGIEKSVQEQLGREKEELESLAAQKANAERQAAEAAEQQRLKREKEGLERLAVQKAKTERQVAEAAEQQRLKREKEELERLAVQKAKTERQVAEAAEQQRLKREKEELERPAVQKAKTERQVAEAAEQQRLQPEKEGLGRLAAQKAEVERRPIEVTRQLTREPEPASPSQGARIINTFIAPSKTFTDLGRNASWWAPWLLISMFALIFIYSMDRQIGFEQISKNEVAHSARADQFDRLPPNQQQSQLKITSSVSRYVSYGIPVMILLYLAIITVVLWATFKFAAGADISFKTAYAIIFYASLPGIIGSTLGTISMFAGVDPEGFNVNNPVATNPAHFMDRAGNKFLYGMASSLDVIAIWTIILMGIGFSCNSKVKRTTAIAVVAGWYLFWKLGAAALAARS
jgi:hypothetical protein